MTSYPLGGRMTSCRPHTHVSRGVSAVVFLLFFFFIYPVCFFYPPKLSTTETPLFRLPPQPLLFCSFVIHCSVVVVVFFDGLKEEKLPVTEARDDDSNCDDNDKEEKKRRQINVWVHNHHHPPRLCQAKQTSYKMMAVSLSASCLDSGKAPYIIG